MRPTNAAAANRIQHHKVHELNAIPSIETEVPISYGLYLQTLRRSLKLTQFEAAALVRVHPNTWARWERDELSPVAGNQLLIEMLPALAAYKNLQKKGRKECKSINHS